MPLDLEDTRSVMSLLPLRTRLSLQAKWFFHGLMGRVPGYRWTTWALFRIKRQGLSALWTPPFSIYKQDRTVYDKRLRWHGWGVLLEPGGFRAYTPTGKTAETYLSLEYAWGLLEAVYRGQGYPDDVEWVKRNG